MCPSVQRSKEVRKWLFHFKVVAVVLSLATVLLLISSYSKLSLLKHTFPPRTRPNITSEQDVYLCAILGGRLGNAFFSYMNTLGVARANNMTLVLKDNSVLPKVLERPPEVDDRFQEKCTDTLFVKQRRCCVFDEKLVKLQHNDRYLIYGCLITWRYFDAQLTMDEVKSRLQFRQNVVTEATSIIHRVRNGAGKNVTLVGMHVRRGDHSGFIAYWNGHMPVTPEYIQRAMQYFTDRFWKVHFLVASEDTGWCRKHVSQNHNDVTIMEGNSAAVDMAALSMTDHMIVTVGTFGWWAGFLNPGIKTYMKDFIGPGSDFAEAFDDVNASDYIYPGWVGL